MTRRCHPDVPCPTCNPVVPDTVAGLQAEVISQDEFMTWLKELGPEGRERLRKYLGVSDD